MGSLRAVGGKGVVRIEVPFDTEIDDAWSAITDPERLSRWHSRVQGVPPFDATIEVTLSTEGDRTVLVVQVEGLPLEPLAFYEVGWQIHAESLDDYPARRVRGDVESRWEELIPPYQAMAAGIG
ncbi:MAG: hypothetical protein M0T79_05515 [Actinomycetota bacterium]|nr:hypothetical protein [Actinomycetota bacterium]